MDDYFFLEPLIVQQLTGELGATVQGVFTARDLQSLMEGRVETPAVYVLYDREVVNGLIVGSSQSVDQIWQVLVAVRVYGDPIASACTEGGALLARIHSALMGWAPPGGQCEPLRKISAPRSVYDDSGVAMFSLAFAGRIVMSGDAP